MARQKKRKSKSRGPSDATSGIVLGLVGLALLGGFGAFYYFTSTRADPVAECTNGSPRAVHAIIFDYSDAITSQQRQFIRQEFQRLKDKAEVGTRIQIFSTTANAADALPSLLSVCVPRRPEGADPLIENAKLLRKEFDEQFSQVIDKALSELLTKEPQQSSPIVESLHAAALTAFGPFSEGQVPLRLTIVSDMIQYSNVASHFREEPNFDRFSRLPTWPSLQPRLKGASVDVLYILRPSALRGNGRIQTRGHQEFWGKLLTASNGVVTSIEPF